MQTSLAADKRFTECLLHLNVVIAVIMKHLVVSLLLSLWEADCLPAGERADVYNLTVVHINDIHAHFEEINVNTSRCRPENDCYGGVARLAYKKNQIMAESPNSVFLNAGDFYQGGSWHSSALL